MDGSDALQGLQGVKTNDPFPETVVLHKKHIKGWKEFLDQTVDEPPEINRDERQFTDFETAKAFVESRGLTLDPQFKHLFVQPRYEQRTPEWHAERDKAITASAWGAACGNAEYGNPLEIFKKKTETDGDVINSPFAIKCMAHGNKYEDAAAYAFEQATGKLILDFGVLKHWRIWSLRPEHIAPPDWHLALSSKTRPTSISEDDWAVIEDLRWIGGSPDGITSDGYVIEIKCPWTQFVDGNIKRMYMWQLLLNMVMAGFTKGYFIQYAPKKELLFSARYDCTEISLPDNWFEEERPKARVVWDWICHFRRTGQIPPALTPKIRRVEGVDGVKFESTRKRRAPSVRAPRQEPEYQFDNIEGTWTNPERETTHAAGLPKRKREEPTTKDRQFINTGSIGFADPDESD
jgi:hypothetical protein